MKTHLLLIATIATTFSVSSRAAELTPSFAGAPAGWTLDRFAPDSFSDVGTFQGRSDVLGIAIGSNGNAANRPAGQQSTFYDTQGMAHTVTGGAGSTLSADLYVPTSWLTASSGARRTDMWGVASDATGVVEYPIIGFTNSGDGGFVGFRVYNVITNTWDDLANPVSANGWNSLSIQFTGSAYLYYVNGVLADTTASVNGATGFTSEIFQAYNFADPTLGGGYVANGYTADWSNVAVPLPAAAFLLFPSLAGLLGFARRKKAPAIA